MVGTTISHYRVLEELGAGGMGVVYLADDLRLNRKVALKFLAPSAGDEEAVERLRREARVASALDHPNIATVYEIDEWEGRTFVAMAYYAGETLRARLERGPLSPAAAAPILEQIADGVASAHRAGIVHRDLKPANVIITPAGQAKILDFGLAKHIDAADDETAAAMTRVGSVVGTLAYMSPEQAKGLAVDARTDVWALGVMAYEMLVGRRPFESQTSTGLAIALASETPAPIRQVKPDTPAEFEQVISGALEKDPAKRTIGAAEISAAMHRLREPSAVAAPRASRRSGRVVAAWIAAAILVVSASAAAWWYASSRANEAWARTEVPAEIARLTQTERYVDALDLAERARAYYTPDEFTKLVAPITRPMTVTSSPEGAEVSYAAYDSSGPAWHRVGVTPIREASVPRGILRWRLERAGHEPAEDVTAATPINRVLDVAGTRPAGMVRVTGPPSPSILIQGTRLTTTPFPDFWIGRHEVTNKEFKEFLDAGGYTTPAYWKQPFTRGGKPLSWEEALAVLRDATGRSGPASWQLGRYPAGQDDLPVTGVSWFEAAAYAEFRQANLPTVHHWSHVAAQSVLARYVAPRAVFGTSAPLAVGTSGTLHRFGAFDLAGNVKEWILNIADADRRYALGGTFDEPAYMFGSADPRSAWDRVPTIGFRIAKFDGADTTLAELAKPVPVAPDLVLPKLVGDDVFSAYARAFSYDRTPITDVVAEPIDTTPKDWTRETVSFPAAYGRERLIVHVLLPKNAQPPYQPVIYIYGGGAYNPGSSSGAVRNPQAAFLLQSGRAVVIPVLKGMWERNEGTPTQDTMMSTALWRDYVIASVKDFSRTIDYLSTRSDLAMDKIGYLGNSRGGAFGPVFLSMEPRVKAAAFWIPGFHRAVAMPEVHPINYAARMKQPVLVLNGRFDPIFPLEISQLPFFRALGQPDQLKHRIEYDSGHNLPVNESIKETLAWFDRFLGPVR